MRATQIGRFSEIASIIYRINGTEKDIGLAKVVLNQKKRDALQQAILFVSLGIAAVVLLALWTYNPSDPGSGLFSYGSLHTGCTNKAGCKGAWMASLLFNLFGYLAYAVPVALVALGLTAFRIGPYMKNPNNPIGGINDVVTGLGVVFALLSGAGLAHLLFESYPVGKGGGALGMYVGNLFMRTFLGYFGSVLFLLSVLLGSITVITDVSWATIAEKVGDEILKLFEKVQTIQQQNAENADSGTSKPSLMERFAAFSGIGQSYLQTGKSSLSKAAEWVNKSALLNMKSTQPVMGEGVDLTDLQATSRREPLLGMPELTSGTNAVTPVLQDKPAASAKPKTDPNTAWFKQIAEDAPAGAGKNGTIILPKLTLLNPPPAERVTQSKERLDELAGKLIEALGHYGIPDVRVVAREPGPVITRFELELPDGTKASKISGLSNDLARNMCVSSVRVVEVIPGRPTIGVEVPNDRRDVVTISEMLASDAYKKSRSPLTLLLGKDISGNPVVTDLARMPHLLVAGTTGSGKSVFVNAVLMSLLFKATPEDVRMIMIDPKMLELSSYEDIPHLIAPVVTDMKHAANALRWCVAEMERRYLLMSKLKVRNIAGFNEKVLEAREKGEELLDPLFDPLHSMDTHPKPLQTLPYIVVIVDEFADMMMVVGKKVEELIARLAQKARASGIHLILATQRPSVDVITGLIKANIPTRIAFQVSTKIDSRTILDQSGAEQLLGYGDMLFMPPGTSLPQRVHGALVTDREVEDVANYLKLQGEPDYIDEVLADTTSGSDSIPGLEPLSEREGGEADPLYDEAVAVVIESRRASISYLQRRLKVGYNRAARMIEDMETAGVVSAVLSNGTRDVLAPSAARD